MISAANRFLQIVVPRVIRPLRVLWNEMIGFVFLVFAIMAGFSAYRGWRNFDGSGDAVLRVVLSGFFALVMGWFGLSSFLRARKISRT